jgi:hypothetical protein
MTHQLDYNLFNQIYIIKFYHLSNLIICDYLIFFF